MELDALTRKVLERLFIELEASGRHVHVTKQQALTLFGHELTPQRELSQPGQFLAKERLTVLGPKGKFENVAVLGPERPEGQVEVSLTDARTLGIAPPVRLSGDVKDSPGAVLIGPKGRVDLTQGVIAARRHIHMAQSDKAAQTAVIAPGDELLRRVEGRVGAVHLGQQRSEIMRLMRVGKNVVCQIQQVVPFSGFGLFVYESAHGAALLWFLRGFDIMIAGMRRMRKGFASMRRLSKPHALRGDHQPLLELGQELLVCRLSSL